MAHAYSPKDATGGSPAPAARLHVKAVDPFKEKAEREKAARDGVRIGAAPRAAVTKTTRAVTTPKKPVLKLVTTTATRKTMAKIAGPTRVRPPVHKPPLVLVASASETAVTDADFAELPNEPAPEKAYRGKRVRGGGGGSGAGGAGGPPADRIFNQDDLAGVLMALALLLLIGLYFVQGGGAPAPTAAPQRLASPAAAPAPVPAPLVDPFGDKPVDLTPKSPPPPPVAQAAPAAAPAPSCPQGRMMRAWFCTAKSVLTDAAKTSLEKDLADWGPCITGKQLVVTGYADTRGGPEYNVSLSTARALAVAEALRAKGVKVAEAAGAGELPGLADGENCANQRRVDVRLSDDPAAPPPSPSCAPPEEFAALSCG